jgi:hypothetical protein
VTRVDELPRAEDRRVTSPGERSAARGHAPAVCGLECLEEQLRRLRAGEAVLAVDHEDWHARRAEGVGVRGVALHAGGVRL